MRHCESHLSPLPAVKPHLASPVQQGWVLFRRQRLTTLREKENSRQGLKSPRRDFPGVHPAVPAEPSRDRDPAVLCSSSGAPLPAGPPAGCCVGWLALDLGFPQTRTKGQTSCDESPRSKGEELMVASLHGGCSGCRVGTSCPLRILGLDDVGVGRGFSA